MPAMARSRRMQAGWSSIKVPSLVALAVVGVGVLPAPAVASLTFRKAAAFTGGAPNSVAIGDLNGDGKRDLAVANGSGNVSVLLGTGAGAFGPATDSAVGANASSDPVSVAIGDLNGDGKRDLAVANVDLLSSGSDSVSVLLGTGSGTFDAATNLAVGSSPVSVAIGDLNGDGKRDLAVANSSGSVSVLLGTGTGTFGAATDFAVGASPRSVAIGDLNGDGKPDLAVANFGSFSVSVLLGTGSGTFGAATNYAVGQFPLSVAIGDLNGDGKPDLAVANRSSDNVSVLLGTGAGTFGAATNFALDSAPASVVIGDLNGDGKLDLALAASGVGSGADNVSVLLGTGTGTFSTPTDFAVGNAPFSVAIGDLNGDGEPDLATANSGSEGVSVLLNAPTADPSVGSLTFGASAPVSEGTVSAPQSVTLANNGSAPLVIQGFAFSGADPADFLISSDTCHAAVQPGGSCLLAVRFVPQAQGGRSASLTALTNAQTPPTISLAGTSGPPLQGTTGPTGPAGSAGLPGPTGPGGPRGSVGPTSTPIRRPDTRIGHGPAHTTKQRLAKFSFSSDKPGSHFECKLDKGRFKRCTSAFKHKVNPGKHVFQVRAIDAAGNVDQTPARYVWRVTALRRHTAH